MIKYIGKCLLIEQKNEKGKEERVLVIGDLHIGYEEALERSGIAIGKKMFDEMIVYFERVFDVIGNDKKGELVSNVWGNNKNKGSKEGKLLSGVRYNGGSGVVGGEGGVRGEVDENNIVGDNNIEVGDNKKIVDKVVLLGDVKHVFSENINQEWNDTLKLFDYLLAHCGEIIVCRGNHDNYLKNIASRYGGNVKVVDYYLWGKYCFVHGDRAFEEMEDKKVKYWVMGHGHPAIKISDGNKVEKYKCFLIGRWKGKEIIIAPSFVESNAGTDVREYDLGLAWKFDFGKFNAIVVNSDLKDLNFGKLGRM